MKHLLYIAFLAVCLSCVGQEIVPLEKTTRFSNNLSSDLSSFNGVYDMESSGGEIHIENLPSQIAIYNGRLIDRANTQSLVTVNRGYVLGLVTWQEHRKYFTIATLNQSYAVVDFRIYPNGNSELEWEQDTIAIPWYKKNMVMIELLRPNPEDHPIYSVYGIAKDVYEITPDLKLKIRNGG